MNTKTSLFLSLLTFHYSTCSCRLFYLLFNFTEIDQTFIYKQHEDRIYLYIFFIYVANSATSTNLITRPFVCYLVPHLSQTKKPQKCQSVFRLCSLMNFCSFIICLNNKENLVSLFFKKIALALLAHLFFQCEFQKQFEKFPEWHWWNFYWNCMEFID